jgi:hypothetical protein
MSYRTLPLSCHCGERPDRILEVGFTSDRHMVVHYWCSACSRVLFVSKPLKECEQACPHADSDDAPSFDGTPCDATPYDATPYDAAKYDAMAHDARTAAADDARFLSSMGICIPD